MKWQAIVNASGRLNEETKSYLVRKLERDPAVDATNLWSDFISSTTKHLHDSQSHLRVTTDEKKFTDFIVINKDANSLNMIIFVKIHNI